MKHKPYSKLPFKVAIFDYEKFEIEPEYKSLFEEDSFIIGDAENNVIGTVEYADDVDFIEDACNNYQEAVELLKEAKSALEFYFANSDLQRTGGYTIDDNIDEFLKKING